MNIFPFPSIRRELSRASLRLLHYGLFAVLCQLALIFLHTNTYADGVEGAMLALRFSPMLEHSLMSLVILFLGVYLIERIHLEGEKK